MNQPQTAQEELRKRIRKSALGFSLLAVGFYLAFIVLSVYRSRH